MYMCYEFQELPLVHILLAWLPYWIFFLLLVRLDGQKVLCSDAPSNLYLFIQTLICQVCQFVS